MEIWSEIRREVLTGAMSKRAASIVPETGLECPPPESVEEIRSPATEKTLPSRERLPFDPVTSVVSRVSDMASVAPENESPPVTASLSDPVVPELPTFPFTPSAVNAYVTGVAQAGTVAATATKAKRGPPSAGSSGASKPGYRSGSLAW